MSENEQRPSSDDIDNSPDSAAEGESNDPEQVSKEPDSNVESIPVEKASEPESVKVERVRTSSSTSDHAAEARIPIAHTGNDGIALIIAGIVAAIMTVAFIIGASAIFPIPASESTPSATTSSPASGATPTEKPAAAETEKPAASEAQKPAASEAQKPSTSSDEKKEEKPTDAEPKKSSAPPSGSTVHDAEESARGRALLLVATTVMAAKRVDAAESQPADSRPGLWSRIVLLIKLAILVCLATVCGLVVLGSMALAQDRPFGDVKSAICRLFACSWLATLALLVPSPTEWLQAAIHYILAVVIFWVVTIIWFRLTPRSTTVLLGGTMALLAATALGARLVVWATWT